MAVYGRTFRFDRGGCLDIKVFGGWLDVLPQLQGRRLDRAIEQLEYLLALRFRKIRHFQNRGSYYLPIFSNSQLVVILDRRGGVCRRDGGGWEMMKTEEFVGS